MSKTNIDLNFKYCHKVPIVHPGLFGHQKTFYEGKGWRHRLNGMEIPVLKEWPVIFGGDLASKNIRCLNCNWIYEV